MLRRAVRGILIFSGFSLGLNLQAFAAAEQNAQANARRPAQASAGATDELEKIRAEAMVLLRKAPASTVFYNSRNERVSIDVIMKDAVALKDGFIVESGSQKLHMRAEMIGDGKSGLRFFLTRLVGDQPANGQVVTITPGMTKNDVQNRFQDLFLSLSTDFAASKSGSHRGVANSEYTMICVGLVGLAMSISLLLTALNAGMSRSHSFKSALITYVALTAFLAGGTAAACFSSTHGM